MILHSIEQNPLKETITHFYFIEKEACMYNNLKYVTLCIGRIDFECNFRDCQFVESREQCTRSSNWRSCFNLFNTRVDKRSFSVFADRKNMHAALLRYLAYFLTIQLDENITR